MIIVAKYATWKMKSDIPGFLWDAWLDMEIDPAEPKKVNTSIKPLPKESKKNKKKSKK